MVNFTTIQASGGDYATIALWEAGTDNDLVTATEGETGQMADELLYNGSGYYTIAGATTDIDYNRTLEPQGDNYDPINDTGPRWTSSTDKDAFFMDESYFTWKGICIKRTYTGSAASGCISVYITGSIGLVIDSCVFRSDSTNGEGLDMWNNLPGPVQVLNCIAIGTGGGTGYGLKMGVLDQLFSNCVAYGFAYGVFFSYGTFDTGTKINNIISVNNSVDDYVWNGASSYHDYCCSEDATATGSNSIINQTIADLFTDAANDDFTLVATGNAVNAGLDKSADFTLDRVGATYNVWDMGAYSTVQLVESSIQASGGDYATLALWESDTDNDLVTLDLRHVGQMADELLYNGSGVILDVLGGTTNSTYFRRLEPQGDNYDPITDTGPRAITSSSGHCIDIDEDFIEIVGLCVTDTGNGDSFYSASTDLTYQLIDSCTARKPTIGGGGSGFSGHSSPTCTQEIRNCIAIGPGNTPTTGFGFNLGSTDSRTYNCVAYNFYRGFVTNASSYDATSIVKNCISFNETTDFRWNSFPSGQRSHLCSGDSTGDGTGSINSQTLADILTDAANDDFTLKAGSNAIDAGDDLSGIFTLDITGATHGTGGTWEMGAYNFAVAGGGDISPVLAALIRNQRAQRLRM